MGVGLAAVDLTPEDPSQLDPTSYVDIVHMFLELRGQGASLSASDVELLRDWEEIGVPADLICMVLLETREECERKKKHFPLSFRPISRKINQILLKQRDV